MAAPLLASTRHPPGLKAHGTTMSQARAGATWELSCPIPKHTPNQALPEEKRCWCIHTVTLLSAAAV